jgi:hypothetical protein
VETVEAGVVCRAQHPGDLVIQRVAGRWLRSGVDLEVLRDRVDVVAQRLDQRFVGEVGRHDRAREKDRL